MAKLIPLDELKDGMELEQPVKNRFGQTLLSANIKLEEKHKIILKTWGIESLYVKDNGVDKEEFNYDPKIKKEAEELLSQRLKWIPQNPNEHDLYKLALHTVLEKYF